MEREEEEEEEEVDMDEESEEDSEEVITRYCGTPPPPPPPPLQSRLSASCLHPCPSSLCYQPLIQMNQWRLGGMAMGRVSYDLRCVGRALHPHIGLHIGYFSHKVKVWPSFEVGSQTRCSWEQSSLFSWVWCSCHPCRVSHVWMFVV